MELCEVSPSCDCSQHPICRDKGELALTSTTLSRGKPTLGSSDRLDAQKPAPTWRTSLADLFCLCMDVFS